MRDPIDFKIQRAHNWLTSGPDEDAELEARFSFGICDAATEPVFGDLRMDGLVCFGPESYVVAQYISCSVELYSSSYVSNMSAFSSQYSHELDYGPREYPVRSNIFHEMSTLSLCFVLECRASPPLFNHVSRV